jgi:hypothetical protein
VVGASMNAASTRPSESSCAAASVSLSLKYVRMFWPVAASIAASSDPKRVYSGESATFLPLRSWSVLEGESTGTRI